MGRIIISDASCLIALTKIQKLDLLKQLYKEVVITIDVANEFGASLPDWIFIKEVGNSQKQIELETMLDAGEASSIALALESMECTLIIDEAKGRKIAKSHGIEIIGTLGVLTLGFKEGLISDLPDTILQLVNQGFRLSDDLIQMIIEKYSRK